MYKKLTIIISACIVINIQAQNLTLKTATETKLSFIKKTENNLVSTSSFGDNDLKNKSISTLTSSIEILPNTGIDALVKNRIKKIKTSIEVMDTKAEYDSDNPLNSDKTIVAAMGHIVGSGYNFNINHKGIITSIDTVQKLAMEDQAIMGDLMKLNVGGNSDIFLIVNKEIKIGETWIDSTINKTSKTINSYKYIKAENGIANIEVNSKITMNGEIEQMGMKMKVNQNGTSRGMIKVKLDNNLIVGKDLVLNMKGTISTDEEDGMKIPSSLINIIKETVEIQ